MDNHKGEARKVDAGALTAEIEQATNLEVAGRQNTEELSPEAARRLGSAAIVSEEGLRRAEAELGRDILEVERSDEVIDGGSDIEAAEHLAEDNEDFQHELGQGLKFEVEATARGQEEVTRRVVPKVYKLMNQSSFLVRDMEDVYRRGVNEALLVFNRRIGDRNGVEKNAA